MTKAHNEKNWGGGGGGLNFRVGPVETIGRTRISQSDEVTESVER